MAHKTQTVGRLTGFESGKSVSLKQRGILGWLTNSI